MSKGPGEDAWEKVNQAYLLVKGCGDGCKTRYDAPTIPSIDGQLTGEVRIADVGDSGVAFV